ncbi:MAG: four helix bundle protein [Acidimicrobiia bacterium]|nr:four helix bundle protein [Acidimicrobiia bacterium]
MTATRKELIEVALPLEAINAASAREKSIRHGHPSTLRRWWARRPLAAARGAAMGLHSRELTVWRKSVDLAREVYRLAPALPREEACGMRSEITRAAASIPANIAEGWSREPERERAPCPAVAQGSLGEAETLLTICGEVGWFPARETAALRP